MLQAILFNKAGRNITSNEVHWRQLFTTSEDSLTSTILGTLFYLPVELVWHILNRSCSAEDAVSGCPRITSVEFWPHWDSGHTGNANFVEPDVFIRTRDIDLIIEAKRHGQQSPGQWRNQLQAYLNEYERDNKKVLLIALDGISNELPETIDVDGKNFQVLKCRWIGILNEIKSVARELENGKGLLNYNDSILNILNDLILGFGIHGYATGAWFEEVDFNKLRSINLGPAQLLTFSNK
jgi:hypothetical protein